MGLIELIFIGVFFILMVIGTVLDRRYSEGPKWYILGIGLLLVVIYFWNLTDFSTVWAAVSDWTFWKPFIIYLVAGLAYSVLEFVLTVRKMERAHATDWEAFMNRSYVSLTKDVDGKRIELTDFEIRTITKRDDGTMFIRGRLNAPDTQVQQTAMPYREIFRQAATDPSDSDRVLRAKELTRSYASHMSGLPPGYGRSFVQVKFSEETRGPAPHIDQARLAAHVGAWTFLWPAYAASLLLGDLVYEVFRAVGQLLTKIGGRFLRATFSDTFKT